MSTIVAAHPLLNTRFECGILVSETPDQIVSIRPKVLENLCRYWSIDQATVKMMSAQHSFLDAYSILRENAPDIDQHALLIDKFPDYCLSMEQLLTRFDVPILFISRDPRAIVWSRHRREFRKKNPNQKAVPCEKLTDISFEVDKFLNEYELCLRNAYKAKEEFPRRVLILTLEDLIENFSLQRKKIFEFLDLDTPTVEFGETKISKQKVRDGIDRSSLDEFEPYLSERIQTFILSNLSNRLRDLEHARSN